MIKEMKKWEMWSVAKNHNNKFPECPQCHPWRQDQEDGHSFHPLIPDFYWEDGKIIKMRWICEAPHFWGEWEKP